MKKLIFLPFVLYCTLLMASPRAHELLKKMSLDQKIGQILMPAIPCNPENPFIKDRLFTLKLPEHLNKEYALEMIEKYHVGSFLYICEGQMPDQVRVTNELQQTSNIPLLFGQDLEPLKRLQDAVNFPYVIALGAADDFKLTYKLARALGNQACRTGVHLIFGPVGDVSNNPDNPVINVRSFGQDPQKVAQHVIAYVKGLQSTGRIAFVKHFAGHGDTAKDSHLDLPTIQHNREHLNAVELVPFKAAIKAGVQGVMTGHILMSALDQQYPCSMSPKTKKLLKELGFDGLIVSDALIMKALDDHFTQEEITLRAFAVNDILQFPADVPQTFEIIKNAIKCGKIAEQELDAKVIKVLALKERLGLFDNRFVEEKNVVADVVTQENIDLKKQIYEQGIVVVRDGLPLSTESTAIVRIGGGVVNPFAQLLQADLSVPQFHLASNATQEQCNVLAQSLKGYATIVIGLADISRVAEQQFGISPQILRMIYELSDRSSVHLVLFGSPYALKLFGKQKTLMVAFEDDISAQEVAANILLGKHKAQGKLPVTIN